VRRQRPSRFEFDGNGAEIRQLLAQTAAHGLRLLGVVPERRTRGGARREEYLGLDGLR
jgi:hypothetical protein